MDPMAKRIGSTPASGEPELPGKGPTRAGDGSTIGGVVVIVLAGLALAMVYNALGRIGEASWGLPWFAADKLAQLDEVVYDETDSGADTAEAAAHYSTDLDDPLAIPEPAATTNADLPEIPAVGRPVQVKLALLRKYWQADAAVIVDARDPEEYDEAHIPGAVSLPYGEVISDPGLVKTLETGGRPVIAYCGGDGCEVSLTVAEELCRSGFPRVAVYTGGFPEWVEAGQPVAVGSEPGKEGGP